MKFIESFNQTHVGDIATVQSNSHTAAYLDAWAATQFKALMKAAERKGSIEILEIHCESETGQWFVDRAKYRKLKTSILG